MATAATMIKEKAPLVFRHEEKHLISRQEDFLAAGRLRKLFRRDAHAGPEGIYQVNSLYFDTPSDSALRQKLDGVDRREKFRLRYYGTDLSFLRLEKKIKAGGLCGKLSARLTLSQAEMLLAGDYGFLLKTDSPLLAEFYAKLRGQGLRPRTIVCYSREAFLYEPGNVRVTFDRDLRTGLSGTDFFNPELPLLRAMEGTTVMEVKYDAFLPDIVRMAVQVPGRRAAACSKYALCRRFD